MALVKQNLIDLNSVPDVPAEQKLAQAVSPVISPQLPLETVPLTIGGRTWQINTVQDQDALLDMADQLAHIPYGFLLWESAVVLAGWLAERPRALAGKQVLELGAGVGLPGLVARALGAEVWQTDHEAQALAVAAHNAAQNGVSGIHRFEADWSDWTHRTQYDLILGADILYETAMHRHLRPIFERNLAPTGQLVLTDPSRPQSLLLVAELERSGWDFELTMQTIQLPPDRRRGGKTPGAVEVALLIGER
jgi:methyltransferase-like protein 23